MIPPRSWRGRVSTTRRAGSLASSSTSGAGPPSAEGAGHHPSHYVQWLEGYEAPVRAVFERVRRDDRHAVQRVPYAGPIRRRLFPSWTMALRLADYNSGAATLELARLLELADVPGSPLPPAPTL